VGLFLRSLHHYQNPVQAELGQGALEMVTHRNPPKSPPFHIAIVVNAHHESRPMRIMVITGRSSSSQMYMRRTSTLLRPRAFPPQAQNSCAPGGCTANVFSGMAAKSCAVRLMITPRPAKENNGLTT